MEDRRCGRAPKKTDRGSRDRCVSVWNATRRLSQEEKIHETPEPAGRTRRTSRRRIFVRPKSTAPAACIMTSDWRSTGFWYPGGAQRSVHESCRENLAIRTEIIRLNTPNSRAVIPEGPIRRRDGDGLGHGPPPHTTRKTTSRRTSSLLRVKSTLCSTARNCAAGLRWSGPQGVQADSSDKERWLLIKPPATNTPIRHGT